MTDPLDSTLQSHRTDRPTPFRAKLVPLVIGRSPAAPTSYALPPGRTQLGRADAPLPLGLAGDPRVSRAHAVITTSLTGEMVLENESSSGTEVNGQRVDRASLGDGDIVFLGESALLVRTALDVAEAPALPGLLGEAPTLRAIRRAVLKVAPSPLTVLLLGESGTGKEVTARALHHASGREGPFVAVNCAAIPAMLAESQLFGHLAGAFTGAQKASTGVFRAADGGTLFLDEIAELPVDLQPKLLRVLEDREVVPVGSVTPMQVNVRVIAATNRLVIDEVRAGRFRGDLYARLAEFTLSIPPLRDRREDILPLLAHQYGAPLPPMLFELSKALLLHPWPFNVRELRAIAAQLRIAADDSGGAPLALASIAERLGTTARLTTAPTPSEPRSPPTSRGAQPPRSDAPPPGEPSSGEPLGRVGVPTRADLEALLRAHRGSVTNVARAAGRSRKQVYRWLEALGVDPAQFRRDE